MRPPVYRRMFGYPLSLLPNQHLATLETGVETIEQAQERTGFTIGYPGWGLIYHMLLSHLDRSKEEILVETGSNRGCTSIVLAQALIDSGCRGHLHTFELKPENAAMARENFAKAGVTDRVSIHVGDVHETFGPGTRNLRDVRFAFLDASHFYKDVMFEFETILPRLAPDAIVLFDNTYAIAEGDEDPRVNGALKDIQKSIGGNLINFENVSWYTPGLAIWQRTPKL